jgi:cyanate permease
LLVTKVVQSRTLLNWSLTYLSLPDKEASISNIISSMITQESIGYTVFLAALYIPSFILIMSWTPETVKEAGADATHEKVKSDSKDKGLDLSFWDLLPKILAMLSPLLAGPVAELLKSFSK